MSEDDPKIGHASATIGSQTQRGLTGRSEIPKGGLRQTVDHLVVCQRSTMLLRLWLTYKR